MSDPAPLRPSPRTHDPLDKFPEEVRRAFHRYQSTGDPQALDLVVLAVVRDYVPKHAAPASGDALPENARLMNDLGFDSLAIAEMVFFLEDLLKVKITNDEILRVTTVSELRAFVQLKLGGGNPPR
jgi:acyl carrier protein